MAHEAECERCNTQACELASTELGIGCGSSEDGMMLSTEGLCAKVECARAVNVPVALHMFYCSASPLVSEAASILSYLVHSCNTDTPLPAPLLEMCYAEPRRLSSRTCRSAAAESDHRRNSRNHAVRAVSRVNETSNVKQLCWCIGGMQQSSAAPKPAAVQFCPMWPAACWACCTHALLVATLPLS